MLYKNYPNFSECKEIIATEALNITLVSGSSKISNGAVIKFGCNENYVLKDLTKLFAKCSNNGDWNVTANSCVKSNCFINIKKKILLFLSQQRILVIYLVIPKVSYFPTIFTLLTFNTPTIT